MIKLTIDSRMINSSGVGRYLTNSLISLLQSNEFEITLLLNGDEDLTSLSNYKFFSTKIFPFRVFSFKEQLYYPKYINKCDIYWAPFFNVPLRTINAKMIVTTLHDVFHLANTNHVSIFQRIYAKLLINRAINISDKIITISDFSKNEILKHTILNNDEKIRLIYCGSPQSNLRIEDLIHKKFKSPYFIYVGNVKPHKNLINALKAFEIFINKHSNKELECKFYIVGKKDGFINGDKDLERMLKKNKILKDRVTFTGYISDSELEEYYKKAFALIFPSLYEGFGLPPLEAMAYGCPTIVSNRASIPEVCSNASIYFDPLNPNDIAMKMNELFTKPFLRDELIKNGLERIKIFTWDNSNKKHIDIFKNLNKNL